MSRIQNILDKAEREGAVRRVRTDGARARPDAATPPPPSSALSTHGTNGAVDRAAPRRTAQRAAAAAPQTLTPARIVSGAHLDAHLITAASTDGAAAEQYRALRTRILHADHDVRRSTWC